MGWEISFQTSPQPSSLPYPSLKIPVKKVLCVSVVSIAIWKFVNLVPPDLSPPDHQDGKRKKKMQENRGNTRDKKENDKKTRNGSAANGGGAGKRREKKKTVHDHQKFLYP